MTMPQVDAQVRYLTDSAGERTDVLVPIALWEKLLAALGPTRLRALMTAVGKDDGQGLKSEKDVVRAIAKPEVDQASVDALVADLMLMVEQEDS